MRRPPPTSTLFPYTTLFRSPSVSMPNQLLNPQLKPEIATSIEGGMDLALFSNRVRFEGTWYQVDRKSTRLNSSHVAISYAVFCLKKKKTTSGRIRLVGITTA